MLILKGSGSRGTFYNQVILSHQRATRRSHYHSGRGLRSHSKVMCQGNHIQFYSNNLMGFAVFQYLIEQIPQSSLANQTNYILLIKVYIHAVSWLKLFMILSKPWPLLHKDLLYSCARNQIKRSCLQLMLSIEPSSSLLIRNPSPIL